MDQTEVNILIVDDVNTIRMQLKELLRSFGFQKVKLTSNVQEAKLALEEETFHLILADWHMAPTDGVELLQFVRANPKLQKVAFVMVTAEATKEKVLDAIAEGVDDYIVKPLTLEHVNKIYQVLQKKQVL